MSSEHVLETDSFAFSPRAEDREAGQLTGSTLSAALTCLRRLGFVQMNDVASGELTAALRRRFFELYDQRGNRGIVDNCLEVGDRRFMMTVDVSGPFNDSEVYANPFCFPIVNALLNGQAVIDSFGAVCALPGAAAQHVHTDHPPLFPEAPLGPLLPCHAVTVVWPLLEPDTTSATTAVWPGSHRDAGTDEETPSFDQAYPLRATSGSVYLMDYRLLHAGTANAAPHARPLLYIVYSRPWFTDAANFHRQPKIRITRDDLRLVPDRFRSLFARAQQDEP
jgi:ectoine hydroxylase-related dioxygenase (phytanoyl-CoA dioxygenase family)